MISEDFAFFGYDDRSWESLVSLLVGAQTDSSTQARGVVVVVVGRGVGPVAAFHTGEGRLDPAELPPLDDLGELCASMRARACLVMRQATMEEGAGYLNEPLDEDDDFVSGVMRFARVIRGLGNGDLLGVWPNPLPDMLLPGAPAAKPASELLLPDDHCAVLAVFDQGELWTAAILSRRDGAFDVLAGPGAILQWTGPLGGDWRRDHRVIVEAVEREIGPVHVGLFTERSTSQALFTDHQAGAWALAYATRNLMIHPMPGAVAAALGVQGVAGLALYAFQAIEEMDPDEVARVATGFWRGLTDGRGLSGLLGFSPGEVLANAWKQRVTERNSRPPSPDAESSGDADPDTES